MRDMDTSYPRGVGIAPEEYIGPSLVTLISFSVPYLFQNHLHLQVLSWLLFARTFPSSIHSLGPSPAYSAALA